MTAVLRHAARGSNLWTLKVHPNDGRYMEEFKISPAELRRFAWALLADLDPEEALAAALEEGAALDDLARPIERPPGRPAKAHAPGAVGPRSPQPGSKKFRVLRCIGLGLHANGALKAHLPDVKNMEALTCELRGAGFITRRGAIHSGPVLHDLTPLGRAAVAAGAQTSVAA